MQQKNDKALVTIAIGEDYIRDWQAFCYPGWRKYADKHGYDILLITSLIDKGPLGTSRPPHWQKLLILQVPEIARYRTVVWLDADVGINAATSPCIVRISDESAVGRRTIGVVPETSDRLRPEDATMSAVIAKRQTESTQTLNQGRTWNDVYRLNGFRTELNEGFNAGVMVLQPEAHAGLLLNVYRTYQQSPFSWYENGPLAYDLISKQQTHSLSTHFNINVSLLFYQWYPFLLPPNQPDVALLRSAVSTLYENHWFLHFLGGGRIRDGMKLLPKY